MNQFHESQWSLHSVKSSSTEDFNWSLQPNYSTMMNDTHLIDTCAAAKEEIDSIRGHVLVKQKRKQVQFLETNDFKTHGTSTDTEQLEQWIFYMGRYIRAYAPNWNQVIKMDSIERNISFNEQCKLRQYVASYNQIIVEMIRYKDNERTRKIEHMYHMLLLKAIEKQCLFEKNLKPEDNLKQVFSDGPNIKSDVYKICNIDSLSQHIINSDSGTNVTHFSSHQTTQESSLISEDQFSSFSSHPDFHHGVDYRNMDGIIQEFISIDIDTLVDSSSIELRKHSNSLISESSLELIRNVDQILPNREIDSFIDASTSDSDQNSNISIQWDNFQDAYTLNTLMHDDDPSDEFLFFGDNYDDVLDGEYNSLSASISDMVESATPEICERNNSQMDQRCIPDNKSKTAEDILQIVENLKKKYLNLKPSDFDGLINICRENSECLLVVLDKDHFHYNLTDSTENTSNAKNHIDTTCHCGIISCFFARIINFLYECSRKVQRSAMYMFLLNLLKKMYALVKFLSRQIRFYRSLYYNQ